MNKYIKIGLFLIIIGIVAFVVVAVLNDSFPKFAVEEFTLVEKTYAKDRFEDLTIDLINQQVIIEPSETDELYIKYYDSERLYINVTEGEQILEMESVNERFPFNFLYSIAYVISPEYTKFYLYLPADTTYDIDLETDNGRITISDYLEAGTLSLETSNGEIRLENVTATGTISLDTSNGRITLDNASSLENISMSTSNGRISLEDVTAERIDCDSLNGDVIGTNLVFADLDVSTSNGSVDISLSRAFADYYLKMSTVNGHYTLNNERTSQNAFNTSADNTIDLRTSNGNIAIDFSE